MDKKNKKFIVVEVLIVMSIAILVRSCVYGLYWVPTGSMETTMLVGELFFANKYTYIFNEPQRGDIVSFNDPLFIYDSKKMVAAWQQYVWGPSNWTKRIIGVPGDHVRGVIEQGKAAIYINGIKIIEDYINTYPLIGVLKESAMPESRDKKNIKNCADNDWHFMTYDPQKNFDEQPWYAIDAQAILCDAAGAPLIRTVEPYRSKGVVDRNLINQWDGSDEFNVYLTENEYWVMGDNRNNSSDSRSFGPLMRELIHGKIVYRLLSADYNPSSIAFDFLLHPFRLYKSIRWERCMQVIS